MNQGTSLFEASQGPTLRGLDLPGQAALVFADIDEAVMDASEVFQAARNAELLCVGVSTSARANTGDQLNLPGVVRIYHSGVSPFFESDIDLVLRSNGIRAVYVCGSGDAALRLAYDAARLGYDVTVLNGTPTPAVLGVTFGEMTEGDFIGRLKETPPGPRNWHEDVKSRRMARPFAERLQPGRTALILIDVLNDFCAPRGVIAKTKATMPAVEAALPRMRRLLASAREAGALVVHVQAIYGLMFRSQGSPYRFPSETSREGVVWCASAADFAPGTEPSQIEFTEVCREGSWGADFHDGFAPQGDETVVRKHRYSAYLDTKLDAVLRQNRIETVVLAGVTTNCCVESTARDLSMADYDTIIAEDCVAVKDIVMHLHEASLEQIKTYFGIVTPSDRIIDAWK